MTPSLILEKALLCLICLRKGKLTHAETNLCMMGERLTKRWEVLGSSNGGARVLGRGGGLLSWARLSEG